MKRCLLTLVALLEIGSTRAIAQRGAVDSSDVLRAGDVVRITVWRKPEFSGDFPISLDGSIAHPLYREIMAAGVPITALEGSLRSFLGKYETDPSLVVTPLMHVAVAGEVRQPAVLTVPLHTTVGQALVFAGGPNERGELRKVALIRGTTVRVMDLAQLGAADANVELRSGDQIVVSRERNIIRDFVAPASSVVGAIAALTSILIQLNR